MAGESTNNSNVKYWLIIVGELLLFLFILGIMSRCNSNKIDVLENNIISYKDSVEHVKLKNGELLTVKQSLIVDKETALNELNMTKNELKDLEKKLDSKIAQINRLNAQLELKDTVYMKGDTVIINDDITSKLFTWSDEWTSLTASVTGKSVAESNLFIYNFKVHVPLEFGLTDDYKVWAKSPNPNLIIEDISSATIYGSNIYPKEKRFHHGLSIGVGINYGIINRKIDIGPSLIYGFTYSF